MGRRRSKGVRVAPLRRPMESRFRTWSTMSICLKMLVAVLALAMTPVSAVVLAGVDDGVAEARKECETGKIGLPGQS